jgi:Transposase, Mutator family
VPIETHRDRAGTFAPQIVRKRQRRFEGFDEKILALYGRGLSTRDIEAHLKEIYGVKVGVFALGEDHSLDFAVSSPAVVLAAIAGRTSRIRLTSGRGAQCARPGSRCSGTAAARRP